MLLSNVNLKNQEQDFYFFGGNVQELHKKTNLLQTMSIAGLRFGGLGEIIFPKKNKKMKNVIMLSQHSKGVFLFSDKAVSGCLLNGSSGRAEFIFSVSVNIFDKFSLMLS